MTPQSRQSYDYTKGRVARPRLWVRTSVRVGLTWQLAASASGAVLVAIAAGAIPLPEALRAAVLVLGFLLVYLNTHALGHYLAGAVVGIRLRGFGLRGTDHPENYPPGLRQLMQLLPMWVALTDPETRMHATPRARAVMYAGGELMTITCSLIVGGTALTTHAPWGEGLFGFTVLWSLASAIVVSIIDKGDFAKARRALRSR